MPYNKVTGHKRRNSDWFLPGNHPCTRWSDWPQLLIWVVCGAALMLFLVVVLVAAQMTNKPTLDEQIAHQQENVSFWKRNGGETHFKLENLLMDEAILASLRSEQTERERADKAEAERDKCAMMNDDQAKRVYEAEAEQKEAQKNSRMWIGMDVLINATSKTVSLNRETWAIFKLQLSELIAAQPGKGE